VIYSDHQN
jgi:superfamily II DNA/RNA helicase